MSQAVVELIGITKTFRSSWTFRSTRGVDDLSFAIAEGEVFGLIGHNGAGKTTTFKLLVGLLRPTSGILLCDGKPLAWHHARQGIGFSPEQPYFYDYLTVAETLNFYGQLYGMDGAARRARIAELAEQFCITHKVHAPMRTLSKGTLQRVAVAQAIMHRPRLVILDEPMSGLDPIGRKEMRDLIGSLRHNGTTVLFSSHILSDAEALCDRVAILAQGRLQEVVDLEKDAAPPESYALVVVGTTCRALKRLAHMAGEPLSGGPDRWTVRLKDRAAVNAVLSELQAGGLSIEAISPERPSLERRFLRYVSNRSNGE
jgi:ABC-2 type transport system ATP-binding protein